MQFLTFPLVAHFHFYFRVEEEMKGDDDDTVLSSSVVSSHVAEENKKEDLAEKVLQFIPFW